MKINIPRRRLLFFLIPLAVLALLPLGLADNPFVLQILIMCMIWGAVAANWDLLLGYGGVFSFGQIAFFTIGAYTSALLTKTGPLSLNIGLSPWLGMFIGGGMASAMGILIGLPCLRLHGIYIALVTFAVHATLTPVIRAGEPIGTGGGGACVAIPPLQWGGYTFSVMERVPSYYLCFAIFAVILFVTYVIIRSRFGLAFTSLRDAEPFAKSLGVNEYRSKLMLFAISAFLTGIMGAFYAHYHGIISHHILGLDIIILVIVMLVIGGLGEFPGAVIAAFIFTFLNEYLRPLEAFRPVILGVIIIVALIATPRGLMAVPEYFARFRRRRISKAEIVS